MKTLKHIFILSCLSLSLSGCGDFLDVNSDQELSYNTFFESEEDCRAYTAGLYNAVWFDFGAIFNYLAGEARSNNYFSKTSGQSSGIFNRFSENSNTDDLETGWDALYSVADEASHVLNGLDRAIENGVPKAIRNYSLRLGTEGCPEKSSQKNTESRTILLRSAKKIARYTTSLRSALSRKRKWRGVVIWHILPRASRAFRKRRSLGPHWINGTVISVNSNATQMCLLV